MGTCTGSWYLGGRYALNQGVIEDYYYSLITAKLYFSSMMNSPIQWSIYITNCYMRLLFSAEQCAINEMEGYFICVTYLVALLEQLLD